MKHSDGTDSKEKEGKRSNIEQYGEYLKEKTIDSTLLGNRKAMLPWVAMQLITIEWAAKTIAIYFSCI